MGQPKKPTKDVVTIRFSPGGRAARDAFRLPDQKERQEAAAVARFSSLLSELFERRLTDIVQLNENDHDFSATVDGQPVTIQLTELVDRNWLRSEPARDGRPIQMVDLDAEDIALLDLVSKKSRRYSKPETGAFWLIVFTVGQYPTQYMREGQMVTSHGLRNARDFLQGVDVPFDEIWFTDLQARPVRIWPRPTDEPPLEDRRPHTRTMIIDLGAAQIVRGKPKG